MVKPIEALCKCGCGSPAPISKYTDNRTGLKKGMPMPFARGHGSRGERNSQWKGELCDLISGRHRAARKFTINLCEKCLQKAIDRHHKDNNVRNNDRSNLLFLCRKCHMKVDGRLTKLIERNNKKEKVK